MNEVPAGMRWPAVAEQLERTEEALTIIKRLLDRETVDFDGRYFRAQGARLYLDFERRPPIYMSAFGPQAAEIAGRLADGIWTLADPQKAPPVIAAYRRSAEQAGRAPGEIILQGMASWAPDDEQALDSAREWKGTLVDENYTDDVHDPAEIERLGDEQVSDTKLQAMTIVSSDPSTHVKRVKMLEGMGATVVALMNVSGADPHGALSMYGRDVLPQLRG
jgi:coenzyme F420-dependent glucose-6-phosphate dehydrogenase